MILTNNLDATLPIVCNVDDRVVREHVLAACKLRLPWLEMADPHDRAAIVVGGGPSMRPLLPMISALKDGGGVVFATNGTVPVLYAAGISSDHHVLLDARPENVAFVAGPRAQHYLIASQCHPAMFSAIAGHPATLWHPAYPEMQEWLGDREAVLIGGGTTVGLQAMSIAYALGFRKIHLFGFDSSYSAAGEGHAYAQPLNADEDRQEYRVGDKAFIAAPWMARQAMEFQVASRQLCDGDAELYVHGTGLLPAIAAQMGNPKD
jgi:uncharacterized Rossmann fold enzyme